MDKISATDPEVNLELRVPEPNRQNSTVESRRNYAVCVRGACKSYGYKKNKNVVLNGLNMTVPKGTIYGLLGASGCGKTTLLSCIVGRKQLDSGEIWVYGGRPGSKGSGIPGKRLGYMPQDISLYGEFTIRETLLYFGWICGMTTDQINEKLDFLSKFLMLPSTNSHVKNLSGGQQRRVSLSAALVHDPELLILDEPTVGVDPILRHNIWEYLLKITKKGNVTIILTTHYIDETRQANYVALMRGGYLLAEQSPDSLLQQFGTDNLEEVYLKLSVMQNDSQRKPLENVTVHKGAINESFLSDKDNKGSNKESTTILAEQRCGQEVKQNFKLEEYLNVPLECRKRMTFWDHLKGINGAHLRAMFWKNYLWTWRNKPIIVFLLFLPLFQIVMFAYTIGGDPKGINIAIKNYEMNTTATGCPIVEGCNATYLSCRYLYYLEKHGLILNHFNTEKEAKDFVRRGYGWAALIFHANYSQALINRIDLGRNVDEWDVDYGSVEIYQDRSNQQIAILLWKDFYLVFLKYIQEFLSNCDYPKQVVEIPIRFNKPIYGANYPNFTDFAVPGALLTMAFFLALAVTAGGVIIDRKEGCFERLLTVGISEVEMLMSHMFSDFVIVLAQIIILLVMTFAACGLTNEGNIFLVFALTLLTAISGMGFGFLVSCICDNEQTATIIGMGSFMPVVMLCGMVWPREGMHYILRVTAYFLPLTTNTDSLRSILHRGWNFTHPVVYEGFIYTLVWIGVFLILSLVALRFRKY